MFKKIYKSKIGNIILISDGEYLTGLYFGNSKNFENYIEKDLDIFNDTIKWLDIYFNGGIPNFTPKYKIETTLFRKEIINILNKIPYGKVTTYGEIAKIMAIKKGINKMSAQAVGHAIGNNPISIIIPCHRVIGKNNNLTGYGGGIDKKIKLLEIEGHNISNFKIPKEKV